MGIIFWVAKCGDNRKNSCYTLEFLGDFILKAFGIYLGQLLILGVDIDQPDYFIFIITSFQKMWDFHGALKNMWEFCDNFNMPTWFS